MDNYSNNNFKNNLEEIKNNFVKIKSLISQKRKPEEKIDNILCNVENKHNINKDFNDNNMRKESDNNELKKIGQNNKLNNNINKNKKRIVKIIKKDKNISKRIKTNKNENINIDFYFDKKCKNQQRNLSMNNNNKINIQITDKNNYVKNKNEINKNKCDYLIKINEELNKDINFSLSIYNKIKYNNNFLDSISNIPKEIINFYSLNSKSISEKNINEYILILQIFFKKYNYITNVNQYNNTNTKNKRIIFIHNSFIQIKKIPDKKSNKINPRNFLQKDEFLIDYEKDSEDDFLEQNAEDINSNDNEDNEEEEEEIFSIYKRDEDFIVPDGHLSQDELSDVDIIEQKKIFQSKKNVIDIRTLLNIRKNYIKPILIDFNKIEIEKNERIMLLKKKLLIQLFDYTTKTDYITKNDDNLKICEDKFPIIIKNKDNKTKGIQNPIKNHFEDIVKKVHGSYDTKEHLILDINKKFEDISKNILNNFFKEKCEKIQKKYWIIKNNILDQFNLNENDLEKIKKENYNIYKEKEERKNKEFEFTKKDEKKQVLLPNNSNSNENNKNEEQKDITDIENTFDLKQSKILDKILINPKDCDDISLEILSDNEIQEERSKSLFLDINDNNNNFDCDSNINNINEEEIPIINLENNKEKCKKNKNKKKKIYDEDETFLLNKGKSIKNTKLSKTNKMININNKEKKGRNKTKCMKKNKNNRLINEYFFLKDNN